MCESKNCKCCRCDKPCVKPCAKPCTKPCVRPCEPPENSLKAIGKFTYLGCDRKGFHVMYKGCGEYVNKIYYVEGCAVGDCLDVMNYYCIDYNELVSCTPPVDCIYGLTVHCKKQLCSIEGTGKIKKCCSSCNKLFIVEHGCTVHEIKNVDDVKFYKHCRHVQYRGVSLECLGLCRQIVHIDSLGCTGKNCHRC